MHSHFVSFAKRPFRVMLSSLRFLKSTEGEMPRLEGGSSADIWNLLFNCHHFSRSCEKFGIRQTPCVYWGQTLGTWVNTRKRSFKIRTRKPFFEFFCAFLASVPSFGSPMVSQHDAKRLVFPQKIWLRITFFCWEMAMPKQLGMLWKVIRMDLDDSPGDDSPGAASIRGGVQI